MTRPTIDEYFIGMAQHVASRGTCIRRKVGCILVDSSYDTLSTGYNGPPRGWSHCIDTPCPGADAPSGSGLEVCEAIHAEMNALMRCPNIQRIHICYVTTSPCLTCIKLLLNTPCRRIVFAEEYTHDNLAKERWTKLSSYAPMISGREWIHHPYKH